MDYFTSSRKSQDFFSNAPDIVFDKILKNLPICNAAQTSVLSKKWKRAWLSLSDLVFDIKFWNKMLDKNGSYDWQKSSESIGDILFYHNGHVHYFYLLFPFHISGYFINHSQWIAFLSKNGVRKIVMYNKCYRFIDVTSHIFSCSELVHLELRKFSLNPPPTDFSGFPNLKYLVLQNIEFVKPNFLCSLIENCRKLETLSLLGCSGIADIVINAPSLQSLILTGSFESLAFRNVCSLKSISITLMTMLKKVDIMHLLARCPRLQSITFDSDLCKLFDAGSIIRSFPVTFNHVDELCLRYLNLGDFGVFHSILSMIQCCPYIEKLDISVIPSENNAEHILDFNYNNKLDHLRQVNIEGITGSSAELKLVEYLLAVSVVLENLYFKYGELSIESEVKISRTLIKFPRVSPKASLVCIEK